MDSLVSFLNRHRYQDELEASPFLPVYEELTDVFYEADPIGLCGFPGLPRDEYGPEALRVIAMLVLEPGELALEHWHEGLWRLQGLPFPRGLDERDVEALVKDAFVELFGPSTCMGYAFEEQHVAAATAVLRVHGLLRTSRYEQPEDRPGVAAGADETGFRDGALSTDE